MLFFKIIEFTLLVQVLNFLEIFLKKEIMSFNMFILNMAHVINSISVALDGAIN